MESRNALISKLQQEILQLEGYRPPFANADNQIGLGPVEAAFPNGIFPLGTVHEMVCASSTQVAATEGFITGLLSVLMRDGRCLPLGRLIAIIVCAGLSAFGIQPHKVIFLNLLRDKDVLWVMEEALKYPGLVAVIGEVSELDFKQSRRLQLAAGQSHVNGFILRNASKKLASTACAARWHIKPVLSQSVDGLPGLGLPRWEVELLKVRNGKPGKWVMEWSDNKFVPVEPARTGDKEVKLCLNDIWRYGSGTWLPTGSL